MQLSQWNTLEHRDAIEQLQPCVAISEWAVQMTARRPYANYEALIQTAWALMEDWDEESLDRALSAHPRIGEQPQEANAEAAFSRGEQATLNATVDLATELSLANTRYEQRFGRVFLIRAKGLDGEAILTELNRRMKLSADEELLEALKALKAITILRLETQIEHD